MGLSPKQHFERLPKDQQHAYIDSLSEQEAQALTSSWWWTARPEQLPPDGDWFCWLVISGRAFGKTRLASEWIVQRVIDGKARRIALVGRTAADVRDVQIEGKSGILAIAEMRGVKANYEPSKRRITFGNGAIATAYSAEEPNLLRGPEHDTGFLDELASYPSGRIDDNDAYGNFIMGLRLGDDPRFIVTTTPRPTKLIKKLISEPSTVVVRGSTFDNAANLKDTYLDQMSRRYEGTRIGRQELYGEVIENTEGALWTSESIDSARCKEIPVELVRVCLAVDPAVSTSKTSDFTAITVAGLGSDGDFYVLAAEQLKASPNTWANRVVDLYHKWEVDIVIAEKNQGGDLVEHTIRGVDRNLPIKLIHAKRGKTLRAEPIAALYEQGRVHHVGIHNDLEDQMVLFPVASDHDDLVDALVYALTELANLQSRQPSKLIVL